MTLITGIRHLELLLCMNTHTGWLAKPIDARRRINTDLLIKNHIHTHPCTHSHTRAHTHTHTQPLFMLVSVAEWLDLSFTPAHPIHHGLPHRRWVFVIGRHAESQGQPTAAQHAPRVKGRPCSHRPRGVCVCVSAHCHLVSVPPRRSNLHVTSACLLRKPLGADSRGRQGNTS